jgi:hypothetical protein
MDGIAPITGLRATRCRQQKHKLGPRKEPDGGRHNANRDGVLVELTPRRVAGRGACRREATRANDTEAGARLSVFVPAQAVTLAKQSYSGITARERLVIRDASEWPRCGREFMAPKPLLRMSCSPISTAKWLSWPRWVKRPSGGFDIVIDSVTQHERGSIVYVTERSPGSGCMATAALTQPVHAVRAPRTDGTIWWRERSVVDNC